MDVEACYFRLRLRLGLIRTALQIMDAIHPKSR